MRARPLRARVRHVPLQSLADLAPTFSSLATRNRLNYSLPGTPLAPSPLPESLTDGLRVFVLHYVVLFTVVEQKHKSRNERNRK